MLNSFPLNWLLSNRRERGEDMREVSSPSIGVEFIPVTRFPMPSPPASTIAENTGDKHNDGDADADGWVDYIHDHYESLLKENRRSSVINNDSTGTVSVPSLDRTIRYLLAMKFHAETGRVLTSSVVDDKHLIDTSRGGWGIPLQSVYRASKLHNCHPGILLEIVESSAAMEDGEQKKEMVLFPYTRGLELLDKLTILKLQHLCTKWKQIGNSMNLENPSAMSPLSSTSSNSSEASSGAKKRRKKLIKSFKKTRKLLKSMIVEFHEGKYCSLNV